MFTILGTDGKEYGPVSAAKVQEWIAAGRANLATKVRRAGDTEWRTLAEFPEFSGAPIPPPAFAPGSAADTTAVVASMELAGRWIRLAAVLLDSVIGFFVMMPGIIVLSLAGSFSHPESPNTPLLLAGFGILGLCALALIAFQLFLLITRGQTIGKKLLGIRIVTFDTEANPGFVKVFLLRIVANAIIGFLPLYGIVDILFIFRDDRRCIHDLLAGTKVVKG